MGKLFLKETETFRQENYQRKQRMRKVLSFLLVVTLTANALLAHPIITIADDTVCETNVQTDAIPIVPETAIESEKAIEAETKAETEAPSETKAEVTTEAPSETRAEATTEAPSETKSETTTEAQSETRAEVMTEAPGETKPEVTTEAPGETEITTEVQSETRTEVLIEAPSETEIMTEAASETESETEIETETETETETDEILQWEDALPTQFTNEWAVDVIAVARSLLGYKEIAENFLAYCYSYAGVPKEYMPSASDCSSWMASMQEIGRFHSVGEYIPAAGDVVFFDTDGNGAADHAGLVISTPGSQIQIIEEQTGAGIICSTIAQTDGQILGYGELQKQRTFCGLTGHIHSADCRDSAGSLICGVAEHIHTDCITRVLTEAELKANYESFLAELQKLEKTGISEGNYEKAADLQERIEAAFEQFELTEEDYQTLTEKLQKVLEAYYNTIAEHADGDNWKRLRDSGWFEEYSAYASVTSTRSAGSSADEAADDEKGSAVLREDDSDEGVAVLSSDDFDEGVTVLSDMESDKSSAAAQNSTEADTKQKSVRRSAARTSENGVAVQTETGATEAAPTSSSVQINNSGGTNTADSVTVSKTIAGTELENVFDITLTVQTPQKIDEVITEPDMAVVIVMDISNTMNDNFGGVTRYAAAMEAAEDFLDKFAASNSLGVSKVGYVAFNTDAHQIFGLQSCTNKTQAKALKDTMRTQTGSIINADGYKVAHNRFTNIEGGLKMAQDMLSSVSNKNKFIILLTDGFPTTYLESGYKGYDPYDTTGRFYDHVLNVPCASGTSYSDEAAIRARNMAASIKNSGTTIFSIGVDVGGQTIQKYIEDSEKLAKGEAKISVVDRTGTTYEIGDASSTESYKNWLKNSIGSGYYYDSTNTAGLKDAYNQIFEAIKTTIETASKADWVASDPIPVSTGEIEFIGLYNKSGTLAGTDLKGTYAENEENTASYNKNDTKITWDLKESGYIKESDTSGNTKYTYILKYRVRLTNEETEFVENKVYETNGKTKLQYRTVQTVDGTTTISEPKTIEFPIPSVHGYLGELTFNKVDNYEKAVAGAEFTLSHASDCSICHGDGKSTPVTGNLADQVVTSDADGKVSFANIPSGHTYVLTETKIPAGYYKNDKTTYRVKVAYDKVTVTLSSGNSWNGKIVNDTQYKLPNTGGTGTTPYTTVGLLMILAAGTILMYNEKKRRKEENVS